jgi:peptide chain release factor 1
VTSVDRLLDRLDGIEHEYTQLGDRMADPEVASDPQAYREAATRYAELEPIVQAYREHREARENLSQARQVLDDAGDADDDMAEMAREEIAQLEQRVGELEEKLHKLTLPKHPDDAKNAVLEVRAGTGGDEATLFAAELLRMYERLAERRGWSFEVTYVSESEIGGIKEAAAEINGRGVYGELKFESGVHRVQRVPETETQGRIHTSAATVAVLPEAEDVELELDENKELRIDSYRASGPGGQHVNKTASAVRVTHIPSGMVVQCQDEKSWHKNRARALKVLRARLYDQMRAEQQQKEAESRRVQIGSGDRSEKIRTYNFPQSRVTDHRIKVTLHKLDQIMMGELDELLEALAEADQAKRLEAAAHDA